MTSLLPLSHFKHHFVFLFDFFCLGLVVGPALGRRVPSEVTSSFLWDQTSWGTERQMGCEPLCGWA